MHHQSSINATCPPRRVGASRWGRARRPREARAPWAFVPIRWATPPYRGHKGKFALCETPPGWIGLVLKLDSPYIYIGGVSPPPSIINQCYLPPKARGRFAASALCPRACAPYARFGSSHQYAGQPHHTGVIKQSSCHAKLLLDGLVWC